MGRLLAGIRVDRVRDDLEILTLSDWVVNSGGYTVGLGDVVAPSSVATDAQAAALTAQLQGVNPGGNGFAPIAAPIQTPGSLDAEGNLSVLVADSGAGDGYAYISVGPVSPSILSQLGITLLPSLPACDAKGQVLANVAGGCPTITEDGTVRVSGSGPGPGGVGCQWNYVQCSNTPSGAKINNAQTVAILNAMQGSDSSGAFSLSSLFTSGTQGGNAPLGIPIGFWLIAAAGAALLFAQK